MLQVKHYPHAPQVMRERRHRTCSMVQHLAICTACRCQATGIPCILMRITALRTFLQMMRRSTGAILKGGRSVACLLGLYLEATFSASCLDYQ